ncbi:MAG TPA: SDR family oxidoreductase [Candidatus Aquilonibacter sp.]
MRRNRDRHGEGTGFIHAAGLSPTQATSGWKSSGTSSPAAAPASQSGHRLPALAPEQNRALATTPTDELLALPFLQPDQITDSLHAYQISKRENSLRVMAEAVRWGKRGARVNAISPGIIMTPLAKNELGNGRPA